jgi:hypothetical protein
MGVVSPSQVSSGDEITASSINTPINQLAAVINGNVDSNNIAANGVTTSNLTDAAVTEQKLTHRPSEYLADFVASGGVVAQSAGLVGTFSNIVYYIAGVRYTATSVANKTYTASKDTYVDVNSSGTPAYNEVANGATAPSLTAGYIRVAKVVTSGAAITSVTQYGKENAVQIYPTDVIGGRFWREIGRTTLTTAGDTITVSSITAKKYLMVLVTTLSTGGTTNAIMRFNNDSGANYASRSSANGGVDGTAGSATSMGLSVTASATTRVSRIEILNIPSAEKLMIGQTAETNTAGAANVPGKAEVANKWANTTDPITRIDIVNIGTGDFAIGSECVVLGHD